MMDLTARRRGLLLVLPTMLLAGACTAETSGTATTPAPSVPSASPSTSTAAPPPTTAPTTTSAPFVAADGKNLKACADGVCEVFVTTGDVLPIRGDVGPVGISVQDGTISIIQNSEQMASSLSGAPGMTETINDQLFLIVAVQGDQGVLRLSKS